MRSNSAYVPLVLRVGLALVFLWFGHAQVTSQAEWTYFVPDWVTLLGITKETFIILNGTAELIAAGLLLLGVYTRWVAILLCAHLAAIVLEIGPTSIGVRDFGLSIACLALFFADADPWQLLKPKRHAKTTHSK